MDELAPDTHTPSNTDKTTSRLPENHTAWPPVGENHAAQNAVHG